MTIQAHSIVRLRVQWRYFYLGIQRKSDGYFQRLFRWLRETPRVLVRNEFIQLVRKEQDVLFGWLTLIEVTIDIFILSHRQDPEHESLNLICN